MDTAALEPEVMPVIDKKRKLVDDEQMVIDRVLVRLGRPRNLVRICARRLWRNHYRVNVYCEIDRGGPVSRLSVTDSFFVTLEDGEILSDPQIEPRYAVN